jgi:hypothetical protein
MERTRRLSIDKYPITTIHVSLHRSDLAINLHTDHWLRE